MYTVIAQDKINLYAAIFFGVKWSIIHIFMFLPDLPHPN